MTASRVPQGRDASSIRVLIPNCRGLDQNLHDVTVVDMGDLPESHVSMTDLVQLVHKWPPAVNKHMQWRQRELESEIPTETAVAVYVLWHPDQVRYVSACDTLNWRSCGGAQFLGVPSGRARHRTHNVPGEVKKVSLETLFPP